MQSPVHARSQPQAGQWITVIVLALPGVAMAAGGVRLVMLGGSWYYLVAGVALIITALLLALRRGVAAASLYALFLFGSTIWALAEVRLDWWQLVPRLWLWWVIGLWMLTPWSGRTVRPRGGLASSSRGEPAEAPHAPDAYTRAADAETRRPDAARVDAGHVRASRLRSTGTGIAPLALSAIFTAVIGISALFVEHHDIHGRLRLDRNVAQTSPLPHSPSGDWAGYGRSPYGDRYSPLSQITPSNVARLKPAWTLHTFDKAGTGDPTETTDEDTPLKVGNTLFICTPHSKVLAVDAVTGAVRWRFDPRIQSPVGFAHFEHMTCRGVSYYEGAAYGGNASSAVNAEPGTASASAPVTVKAPGDSSGAQAAAPTSGPAPSCPRRVFLPTADARLIALDADTGKPCESFGDHGTVDLRANIGPFTPGGYYSTSPPVVTRNLVIIGGHVTDNESTNEPSGVMRAYDVHDGHLVWNWDAGNPNETEPLSPGKLYTRNSPNMWSVASVDERLGMIYLPMGNQTPDQWGGDRTQNAERFGAGVVALDLATGHVKWTYQFTHHDLWDMDVGGQPTLMDLQTAAGVKPALLASTKQGSIYALDRRSGAPLMPITEAPVPQGAVPGDHTSPTQPVSALNFNPPVVRERDMWGATPFDQLWCRVQFRSLRYDGMFTPPSTRGSLVFPGNFGAFDWGGISVDPTRQILFANPDYMAFISRLIPRDKLPARGEKRGSETSGIKLATGAPYAIELNPFLSPLGVPCQAPPWGYVAGIDLTSGKIAWKLKNGTIRDNAPLPVPFKLGVPSLGGTIVTAGGVGFLSGTLDYYLRAYDLSNGKELWRARLPAGGQATPMTYAANGKQYVLVTAGGHGSLGTREGDAVIAYALP